MQLKDLVAFGFELRIEPLFDPRLERERFSGGVNLSAQERNKRRISESMHCYVIRSSRLIVGSTHAINMLIEQLSEQLREEP